MDIKPIRLASGRASEVLSGKRGLSLQQIRNLNAGLQILCENLLGTTMATRV